MIPALRLRQACAFIVFIAAASLAAAESKQPVDPQALLTQYKCYICHANRETKAGPAFVAIADSTTLLNRSCDDPVDGADDAWIVPLHNRIGVS